jgi:hypothetical protein
MSLRKHFRLQGYARHPIRPADKPNKHLRALQRAQVDRLLGGVHRHQARRLLAFLSGMTLEDGAALVALIKADGWCDADAETREIVLSVIDGRVARLREASNLAVFDDPLPGDGRPANVSMRVREILGIR